MTVARQVSHVPVAWQVFVEDSGEFDYYVFTDEYEANTTADENDTEAIPLYAAPTSDAIEALRAEVAALSKDAVDARRYHYLKKCFRVFSLNMDGQHSYCLSHMDARGPSLDAAIDAMLPGEKP